MHKPKVSNMVRFYGLLLLSEKKRHGYELMKEIGERLDKKVSPGQIYPFLSELEADKLVHAGRAGERDKIEYELTPEGKKFVESMILRFGGLIEIAFKPHLTICTQCGCKVFEGGVVVPFKGKKLKFCCGHCAASYGVKPSAASLVGHDMHAHH